MNSRQRRKLEAERHNMARIESEAYAEDRIREPEKYRRVRNRKAEVSVAMALAMCSVTSPFNG